MSETKTEKALKPKKERASFCYGFLRFIATIGFNTFVPVRYKGGEKANAAPSPSIIIANHTSIADPVIMAYPIHHRQVTYLGKKELTKNWFGAWVMKEMRCITVDRHHTDMAAMRACNGALKAGKVLGIFPEGTRHHAGVMEELEGGIAMIALRSGAPLIPMYIDGKLGLFRPVHCYVGDPIPYDDLRAQGVNKETCEALLERIRGVYRDMVAAAKV